MQKKFGKILTAIIMVMAIMVTIQPTALTGGLTNAQAKTKYSLKVALYLKESNDNWSWGKEDPKTWSIPKSKTITVTKDGTYTLTLKNLNIPKDKLCLCYIKDVDAENALNAKKSYKKSNVPSNLKVTTKAFKVNGKTLRVSSNVRTGLKKGIFDVAYRNNWDNNDNCVTITSTITTLSVTFTIKGMK